MTLQHTMLKIHDPTPPLPSPSPTYTSTLRQSYKVPQFLLLTREIYSISYFEITYSIQKPINFSLFIVHLVHWILHYHSPLRFFFRHHLPNYPLLPHCFLSLHSSASNSQQVSFASTLICSSYMLIYLFLVTPAPLLFISKFLNDPPSFLPATPPRRN